MICKMCNEQILGDDGSGLCYLHRKYNKGICGPYFETLYDLVYWKATFLKKWESLGYGKISVACAEHVEVQKMNQYSVDQVKVQVQQQLAHDRADLSMYQPLVRKLAYQFSSRQGITFPEAYNQGMLILTELERKVDKSTAPKMISAYVKRSVHGAILRFVLERSKLIRRPQDHIAKKGNVRIVRMGFGDWQMPDDKQDNPQKDYLAAYKQYQAAQAVDALIRIYKWSKSPVYMKVIKNMFAKHPKTQAELATQLRVTQSSVSKATKVIFNKAKEMGYG